jgi:septal ring factor EnvC (AmiA/AmiB activator)
MIRRVLVFGLLVLLSTGAVADGGELKEVQATLSALNQELTATYQQFQMVAQARRAVLESMSAPHQGLDPRSVDQVVEERAQAMQQERDLSDQMTRLLGKAREIEEQMKPVLDRLYQLIPTAGNVPPPQPEPAKPVSAPETSPAP